MKILSLHSCFSLECFFSFAKFSQVEINQFNNKDYAKRKEKKETQDGYA